MSEWQRSQACDCIKYFAGIFLPSRVCAELGKNFPLGPSPSPSMVSVGMYGLTTRLEFFHAMLRAHHEPAAIHHPLTPKCKLCHSSIPRKCERGRNSLGYPTASLRGAPEVS